ncbi:TPA: histone [Candidatus Micrarchaeota archaeon]|nr:histone [Candidatus Micrarchaeota archaeon]
MDRFLRNAGAERVGEDASIKLCQLLEDSAEEVIAKAKVLARHAGRNNVIREDIVLAANLLYAL